MSDVENYLPFIEGVLTTDLIEPTTGVQIGQYVLFPGTVWLDAEGIERYSTLEPGSTFTQNACPELAVIFPDLVLPEKASEENCPFDYRVIASKR